MILEQVCQGIGQDNHKFRHLFFRVLGIFLILKVLQESIEVISIFVQLADSKFLFLRIRNMFLQQ